MPLHLRCRPTVGFLLYHAVYAFNHIHVLVEKVTSPHSFLLLLYCPRPNSGGLFLDIGCRLSDRSSNDHSRFPCLNRVSGSSGLPWQIGQSRTPSCHRFNLCSNTRASEHVSVRQSRDTSKPIPAWHTTSINRAPLPLLWSRKRASRLPLLPR